MALLASPMYLDRKPGIQGGLLAERSGATAAPRSAGLTLPYPSAGTFATAQIAAAAVFKAKPPRGAAQTTQNGTTAAPSGPGSGSGVKQYWS